MPPAFPVKIFSLDALSSKEKPSVKKPVDRASQEPVDGRSTGNDFEIYRSGRENPDRFHLWYACAVAHEKC